MGLVALRALFQSLDARFDPGTPTMDDTTTTKGPDLFLVKLTADEALVLRLALRGVAPHLTAPELVTAMGLEHRLVDARPLAGTGR